jgi:hypothetical protein
VTGRKHTFVGSDRKRHVGWEYLHVCVDDATRLAYAEVLGDETAATAIGFLWRARLLPRTRRPGAAPDDRQRPRLPLDRAHDRL